MVILDNVRIFVVEGDLEKLYWKQLKKDIRVTLLLLGRCR